VAGHYCSSSRSRRRKPIRTATCCRSRRPRPIRLHDRNMWNTFRVCGRDDQQGSVAGEYVAKNFKGKNVAILHDKSTYGKGWPTR